MNNIWFTSDHHFGHTNIIKFCDRPFASVDEMDQVLVDTWNKNIQPRDTVIHLGDFTLRNAKAAYEYISRLNGEVWVIEGSHDDEWYGKSSAIVSPNKPNFLGSVYFMKHEGKRIFCSHYSHRTWPKSHHGSLHIYGHSHGNLPGLGRSMDVGVDSAYKIFGEYKPFSFDEVVETLEIFEPFI